MDLWRIGVLGDTGVGKASLAIQFTHNCFLALSQTYDPVGGDVYRRQLMVDNRMCFVEAINIGKQEDHAFILMYSITSRTSFDKLELFHQSIHRIKGKNSIFILVGNKCDREYAREVSKEEGTSLAKEFGCEFLETSATTAKNVERVFTNLVRTLRRIAVDANRETFGEAKRSKKCIIM
ncbi:P-loop containing nucleoside triphosphate hydrolase protein [Mycena maculata]|uniref:P-loop containing nucleoside triphosphate hydrolase protein n=1 Tax=Mycena maculata TaxID=230809 RepID=A0AAD7JNI1_9AGAR|nr:P-loop containing nucleoside triphosphate hydrolase protein [Mycena maculata]